MLESMGRAARLSEKVDLLVKMCEAMVVEVADPVAGTEGLLRRTRLAHKILLSLAILPQQLTMLGLKCGESFNKDLADALDAAAAKWRTINQGVLISLVQDVFREGEAWMEASRAVPD